MQFFTSDFTLGFSTCFLICLYLCVIKKPGARVLYLGAASGTTVSHVSDVVGPVSTHDVLRNIVPVAILEMELLLINSQPFCRLEWFMQWNFLTEVVGTWLTWQRSGQMLFPSLKMLDIQQSTECWLAWLMWYFPMLHSLIRLTSFIFLLLIGPWIRGFSLCVCFVSYSSKFSCWLWSFHLSYWYCYSCSFSDHVLFYLCVSFPFHSEVSNLLWLV